MRNTQNRIIKYVIITSAYNEEKNIEETIKSVIKQTIRPVRWVIVNDGSTDNTRQIIEVYADEHKFIKLINKENENLEFGAHVSVNFNIGLKEIETVEWDYIAQLDADISIDRSDFYEFQINEMLNNPKLGNTSGITYVISDGIKKINTNRPHWRTGGATKLYTRNCFEDIGGIKPIFAWDGLDVYKARYNGWETKTFFELEVNHLAASRMTNRHQSTGKAFLIGKSLYQRGYPVEFVLLKSLSFMRISNKHFNQFIKGYFDSRKRKIYQYVNKDEKRFIRKFQYYRLAKKTSR